MSRPRRGAEDGRGRHVINSDNDDLRVTTWTFGAAGAATGRHRHEFDPVVVPITGGRFEVVDTEHDVVSAAPQEAVFVEIGLKR